MKIVGNSERNERNDMHFCYPRVSDEKCHGSYCNLQEVENQKLSFWKHHYFEYKEFQFKTQKCNLGFFGLLKVWTVS